MTMKHISGKVNLRRLGPVCCCFRMISLGGWGIDEEKQKWRIRERKGEKWNQESFTFVEGVEVET